MKLNFVNPKRIILFALAMTAFTTWAQTPAWQQQLERLDKEADELYDEQDWKRLVANQKQVRKIIMTQPDSVRQEYLWDTDLSGNFYYNLACWQALAGDKKGALSTFEYYTDRVIDSEEIRLPNINADSDLNSLRKEPRFIKCMERLQKWGDYKQILKDAKPYFRDCTPKV